MTSDWKSLVDIIVAIAVVIAVGAAFLFLVKPPDRTRRAKLRQVVASSADAAAVEGQRHAVFISYRREDAGDAAGRLYDYLEAGLGTGTAFKDVDSIPAGSDFRDHLERSLANCKVFLLLLGDGWTGPTAAPGSRRIDEPGDFMRIEIETALKRDVLLIPLLLKSAKMPSEEMLPDSIRSLTFRQAAKLQPDPYFKDDVARLIRIIKKRLAELDAGVRDPGAG